MKLKTMTTGICVLMLGLGVALADNHSDGRFLEQPSENDLRASVLMGADVFVSETDVSDTTVEDVPDDWESVASVDDILLAQDGTVRGVLFDVGGFLGLGARHVMVSMDALSIVRQQESDDLYVVFTSTQEELEQAPEYQDDPAAGETMDDGMSDADESQADDGRRLGVPEEAMEGFEPIEVGTLTVDELTNATVYDRLNERVSDIRDVQLSSEGQEVVAVLIDIGGFLGLGARTVAVDIDELEIQADPEREDLRVYLDMTREELEALPEHEE